MVWRWDIGLARLGGLRQCVQSQVQLFARRDFALSRLTPIHGVVQRLALVFDGNLTAPILPHDNLRVAERISWAGRLNLVNHFVIVQREVLG